jgi:hypothetical protein
MKKSAVVVASLLWISILTATESIHAAKFFCPSGDVTCLIAAINGANGKPGHHVIELERGIYTIGVPDNVLDPVCIAAVWKKPALTDQRLLR